MNQYLRDLLDQLPSDAMRSAFQNVEDDVAIEILECYHFTAGLEQRDAFEEFFEDGGFDTIHELLAYYRDKIPTSKDLREIWDLPSPE